jgi:hypothetical protein
VSVIAVGKPVTTAEKWHRYDAWNEGLKRELFSGQWEGQPVYLDLEPEVLARVAGAAEDEDTDPAEALLATVRPTLHPRPDGVGLFREHLARERRWRMSGGTGAPPFLAVLAFLSLVAEEMRGDSLPGCPPAPPAPPLARCPLLASRCHRFGSGASARSSRRSSDTSHARGVWGPYGRLRPRMSSPMTTALMTRLRRPWSTQRVMTLGSNMLPTSITRGGTASAR